MFIMKKFATSFVREDSCTGWCRDGRSLVALACYGWWGVIYPELTMLPSAYEIVYEEQAEETKTVQKDAEVVEWNSDSQIYWMLLEAEPEQIHFKSRLLAMLKR